MGREFKAIFFGLDGTLVDIYGPLYIAARNALDELGQQPPLTRERTSKLSQGLQRLGGALDRFGVLSACLMIAVLPTMATVLKKRSTCQKGTFHGVTANIGPTDSYMICAGKAGTGCGLR